MKKLIAQLLIALFCSQPALAQFMPGGAGFPNYGGGGGGGSGTVTSFSATPTAIFDVTSATTTPALSLDNQNANIFLGGPSSGGAATPGFRALVDADIPTALSAKIFTACQIASGSRLEYLTAANKLLIQSASIATADRTLTLPDPGGNDSFVYLALAQTLTNKTLTSPVISTISNTGTITLPTATTTLVGRDTTDTLTNKTIGVSQLSGAVSIANGGTNNASLGVTAGGVPYTDGSKLVNAGAGTSGQLLQSNGSSAPTWVSALANGTTATTQSVLDNSTKVATTAAIKSTTQSAVSPWTMVTTTGQSTATLNNLGSQCPSVTFDSDGTITTNLRGSPTFSTSANSCYGDQLMQSISGDFTLTAQLCSFRDSDALNNTNNNRQWSGGCLVLRQGNTNSDKYYVVHYNLDTANAANGSANFLCYSQYTTTTGGSGTQSSSVTGITLPAWLRIVGSSGNYSTYYSADGSSWTQIGTTQAISFSGNFNVGLGTATSGAAANDPRSNSLVWRNVSLTQP